LNFERLLAERFQSEEKIIQNFSVQIKGHLLFFSTAKISNYILGCLTNQNTTEKGIENFPELLLKERGS